MTFAARAGTADVDLSIQVELRHAKKEATSN
jgi:hypothetical protein